MTGSVRSGNVVMRRLYLREAASDRASKEAIGARITVRTSIDGAPTCRPYGSSGTASAGGAKYSRNSMISAAPNDLFFPRLGRSSGKILLPGIYRQLLSRPPTTI